MLSVVAGRWLFITRPGPRAAAYLGDDSVALLLRQQLKPGGRALDLCTGPGLQALHAAGFAREVHAVELSPVAAALARVNTELNGVADRVHVHVGDLWAPVRGQRFDNVICNPPFLPLPDDLPYPSFGHGGEDGLRVVRRVLEALPAALLAGGSAQLVGALLGDERDLLDRAPLESLCRERGVELRLTLVARLPLHAGARFFEMLADTAAVHAGDADRAPHATRLDAWTRARGATCLRTCFYFARLGPGRLLVHDLDAGEGATWFA
jgi:SAM-dependent methyltransferase